MFVALERGEVVVTKLKLKLVVMLSLALILLSGCFGSGDDKLKELKKQSNSKDFGVLVEVREGLIELSKDEEYEKRAKKLLEKVNEKIKEDVKTQIDKSYNEGDLKESYRYAEILLELSPSESEAKEVFERMKKEYSQQEELDNLINLLEREYKSVYDIFSKWNNTLDDVLLSKSDLKELQGLASQNLMDIKEIRTEIQKNNLVLKDNVFYEIQNELFEYINSIEQSFESLLMSDPETLSDYKSAVSDLQPGNFNSKFVGIQEELNKYIDETDGEGNKIRKLKGELNFSETKTESKESDDSEEEEKEEDK